MFASWTEPLMSVNGFGESPGQANWLGSRGGAASALAGEAVDNKSTDVLTSTAIVNRRRRIPLVPNMAPPPMSRQHPPRQHPHASHDGGLVCRRSSLAQANRWGGVSAGRR